MGRPGPWQTLRLEIAALRPHCRRLVTAGLRHLASPTHHHRAPPGLGQLKAAGNTGWEEIGRIRLSPQEKQLTAHRLLHGCRTLATGPLLIVPLRLAHAYDAGLGPAWPRVPGQQCARPRHVAAQPGGSINPSARNGWNGQPTCRLDKHAKGKDKVSTHYRQATASASRPNSSG